MRKLKKFKSLKRELFSPFFIFSKVLVYKKSKWGAVHKKLKKIHFARRNFKALFFNQFFNQKTRLKTKKKFSRLVRRVVYVKRHRCLRFFNLNLKKRFFSKKWRRFKEISRSSIAIKTQYHSYFASAFSKKIYKANLLPLHRKHQICSAYIKPEFRIDLLLFRLYFFESPQAAEVAIRSKKILRNNSFCSLNQLLRAGDLVQNLQQKSSLHVNCGKFLVKHRLPSFAEVDYFCSEAVILYNWMEMQPRFLLGEIKTNISIKSLRYCFSR